MVVPASVASARGTGTEDASSDRQEDGADENFKVLLKRCEVAHTIALQELQSQNKALRQQIAKAGDVGDNKEALMYCLPVTFDDSLIVAPPPDIEQDVYFHIEGESTSCTALRQSDPAASFGGPPSGFSLQSSACCQASMEEEEFTSEVSFACDRVKPSERLSYIKASSTHSLYDDVRKSWRGLIGTQDLESQWLQSSDNDNESSSPLKQLLKSKTWEICVLVLIISNGLFTGIQVQHAALWISQGAGKYETPLIFQWIEILYCLGFSAELFCRVLAYGIHKFCTDRKELGWNYFDTVALIVMLVDTLMTRLLEYQSGQVPNVSILRVGRMLRVLRAVRLLRLLKFLRGLRVLANSLMAAMKSLIWTSFLIFILLYVFAVFMTQGITDLRMDSGSTFDVQATPSWVRFGTIDRSMLTFFQTMTNGVTWGTVYDSLIALPRQFAAIYVTFVGVAIFAIVNVVNGIFVETALHTSQKDRDSLIEGELRDKETYIAHLRAIFKEMDLDQDGKVAVEEFQKAMNDERVLAYFNALGVDFTDIQSLFALLDRDCDGCISLDEFWRGCMKLKGEATSVDVAKLQYEIEWLMYHVNILVERVSDHIPARQGDQTLGHTDGTATTVDSSLSQDQPEYCSGGSVDRSQSGIRPKMLALAVQQEYSFRPAPYHSST